MADFIKTAAGYINLRFVIRIDPARNGKCAVTYQIGDSADTTVMDEHLANKVTNLGEMPF